MSEEAKLVWIAAYMSAIAAGNDADDCVHIAREAVINATAVGVV